MPCLHKLPKTERNRERLQKVGIDNLSASTSGLMLSFKQNVLGVVRAIPRGKVLSYKQVAERAGEPRAWRAVGAILSRNYDPAIPCHRVICSDGSLGKYNRGGIAKKKELLKKEGYLT